MIPEQFVKEFGDLRKTSTEDVKPGALIIDFFDCFNEFDQGERLGGSLYYYLVGSPVFLDGPVLSHRYKRWSIVELIDDPNRELNSKQGVEFEGHMNDDFTYVIAEGWDD